MIKLIIKKIIAGLNNITGHIGIPLTSHILQEESCITKKTLDEVQHLAHIGSWELDLSTNNLSWSDEIFNIFEIDKEKFGASYESFLNAIHPEDRERVNIAYTESVKNHKQYDINHRLLMVDGRIKYVHERCETFYDEGDKPLRSIGTVQDTTEYYREEEKLHKNESLLRTLIDTIPVPIFYKDRVGRYLGFNKAYESFFGASKDKLIGKTVFDINPPELAIIYNTKDEELFKNGGVQQYESQVKMANDGLRDVIFNKAVFSDSQGSPAGLVGAILDITERKKTEKIIHEKEAELREIIENSPVATIVDMVVDGKEKALIINKEFTELFGYTIIDIPDVQHWWALAYPDEKERQIAAIRYKESIEQATKNKIKLLPMETSVVCKDKSTRFVRVSLSVLEDKNIITFEDLTDRKLSDKEHQANLKFMESMDKINKAILGTNNLDEMMRNVLDVVLEVMDCDRAWLLTPTEPWILSYRIPMERARPGFPGAMAIGIEVPIDPETALLLQKARATDGPVTFDLESDPPLPKPLNEHFGIQSQILMDIYPKVNESWMFGLHQCSYQRVWTKEEKRLFEEIGRRITDALTSMLSYRNLKESEEKYSRIITTSAEGILSLDKEYKLAYVNPRILDMLGYTQKEMLGHKIEEYMPLDEIADHQHQMEERRKGKATVYTRRFLRKDGTIILCSISGTPIFDNKKKYDGSFGMVTDITKRKLAEDELQEQVRFSESLLRFSRNLEQAQTYGEALAAAQKEIGDIIGYKNVWAYTVSNDKKFAHSIVATGPTAPIVLSKEGVATIPIEGDPMMEKIVSSKDIVVVNDAQTDPNVNKEIVKKIGNRTIVNVPIILFDRNLGSIGMGTFGDEGIRVPSKKEQIFLTAMASHMAVGFDRIRLLIEKTKNQRELLKANQELTKDKTKDEALLESLGEGIIAIDNAGIIVAINKAAERIIGWKETEILGKNIFETLPAIDEDGKPIPREKRLILSVLESKKGTEVRVLNYVRRDGRVVPVSVTATPFILGDETIGAVNVFHDISKEKELEETRRDLLSLASHQLRTPLSGTKWLIETLKKGIKGPLNKDQAEYLDEIYKINERMTTLVHEMLGVLRMESGTIPTTTRRVAASKIITTEIDNLSPTAKGKGVSLRTEIVDDEMLNTDPLLMQQLLEVFISNSITYSESGKEILIKFHKTSDEAIFEVCDSGIGIPKDEQYQIFQRFYRATNAKTFDTHGTGLGLHIATIIAKKLGVRLSYESQEGVGSQFRIHFPLNKNE